MQEDALLVCRKTGGGRGRLQQGLKATYITTSFCENTVTGIWGSCKLLVKTDSTPWSCL